MAALNSNLTTSIGTGMDSLSTSFDRDLKSRVYQVRTKSHQPSIPLRNFHIHASLNPPRSAARPKGPPVSHSAIVHLPLTPATFADCRYLDRCTRTLTSDGCSSCRFNLASRSSAGKAATTITAPTRTLSQSHGARQPDEPAAVEPPWMIGQARRADEARHACARLFVSAYNLHNQASQPGDPLWTTLSPLSVRFLFFRRRPVRPARLSGGASNHAHQLRSFWTHEPGLRESIRRFLALTIRTGQPISRQLFQQYRAEMVDAGLGGSTINVRLSGVRKLVNEARENGLVDPSDAGRIVSVPNVPAQGVRLGHWLTVEQTRDLLAVPDRSRLKGKRDHAILSVLPQSALRREEASHLDMSHIQLREGRWVLADIRGKRGRVRTVALPASAKAAIDEWTRAAGIISGPVFRRLTKSGRVLPGEGLGVWAIWDVVVTSGQSYRDRWLRPA